MPPPATHNGHLPSAPVSTGNVVGLAVFLVAMGVLFVYTKSIHYLVFHTIAELSAITVSFAIFTLTWASLRHLQNNYLVVVGAACGAVGIVDVFHTLTFRGMNLFPGVTTNHPTQFWLTARFIEALAMLSAALLFRRRVNFAMAVVAFVLLGAVGSYAVMAQLLPATFVEGVGLTPFKVWSEYTIIAILVAGLWQLWRIRGEFDPLVHRLLMGSVVCTIATELCFVHYVSFYDFVNELGHYFRFISFVLAFLAIVVTGVQRPADLLFREVAAKERDLEDLNRRLVASEGKLKEAQVVAGVGSWFLDVGAGTLTGSDEAWHVFGLAPGQSLALVDLQQWLHQDDRDRFQAGWQRALRGEFLDLEHRILKDEEERWLHLRAEPRRAADGRTVEALLGTVQDITARKRAELELRETKERLEAAASAGIVGVWDWDIVHGRLFWDKVMVQLHGLSSGSFGGTVDAWMRMVHSDDRARVHEELQAALRGERGFAAEFRVVWPDGSLRFVKAMARTTRDDQHRPLRMIGVTYDLTEQKAVEQALDRMNVVLEQRVAARTEQLAQAKEVAEAANRAKSAFLAKVSHELRTPLNGIMGMIALARRQAGDPRQQRRLGKAALSAERLLRVIDDILDFSDIEASRLAIESAELTIAEVLARHVPALVQDAEAKGLTLEFRVPEGLARRKLIGDARRLGQVLQNLTGNAIKFTKTGSVTVSVAAVEEAPDSVLLRWEVADTGIGISLEDRARLFAAFEQADNSDTRHYGGTGLGLAISRRLIWLMGGDISVDSEPGRGSTISFTARLGVAGAGSPVASAAGEGVEAQLRGRHAGARILLAEDDPVNQEVFRNLLESVGLTVVTADDGVQAVDRARAQSVALILMDVQMPNRDGLTATREIRELPGYRTTPIVATTAGAFEQDRRACLAAGMSDYLAKPVAPERLLQVILDWLDRTCPESGG